MHNVILFWGSIIPLSLALFLHLRCVSIGNGIDILSFKVHILYFSFYFILAPVIHFFFNVYIEGFSDHEEVISSVTILNIINTIGLLFSTIGSLSVRRVRLFKKTNISWNRLKYISIIFIFIGFCVWGYLLLVYGKGVFVSVKRSTLLYGSISIYYFIVIECLPILFIWAYISHAIIKNRNVSTKEFWMVLFFVALVALVFGGVRGSRISMLFDIIIYILLFHIYINPVGWRRVSYIIIAIIIFNPLYSIYKYGGVDAVENYIIGYEVPTYVQKYSNITKIILHDFARSDVQALIIDRTITEEYTPNWRGDSYIFAIMQLIPRSIRPELGESKTILGAVAQYGTPELYGRKHSTRIYGLTGEAILNFGVFGVPLAFFIFGIIHRKTLLISGSMTRDAAIFYPLILIVPIYILFYDTDNIVFQVVKVWLIPTIVFMFSRVSRSKY